MLPAALTIFSKEIIIMKKNQTLKLTLAAVLCAVAVVGSMLSFPVFGSKCAPVQHVVNVLCAVLLGPWYGVAVAFAASLIRNLLGLGSLLAFPGSMCGALLAGLLYRWQPKLPLACLGEIVGTGVISSFLAWPIAHLLMGRACGPFTYFVPFMLVALTGSIIAAVLVFVLKKSGALAAMARMAGNEKN